MDVRVTGEGRQDRWLVSHCIGRRDVMLYVCPRTATPSAHTVALVICTLAQGTGHTAAKSQPLAAVRVCVCGAEETMVL